MLCDDRDGENVSGHTRQLWVRISPTLGVVDSGWFDLHVPSFPEESISVVGNIGTDWLVDFGYQTLHIVGLDGSSSSKWLVGVEYTLLIWKVGLNSDGNRPGLMNKPVSVEMIPGTSIVSSKLDKSSDDIFMMLCRSPRDSLYRVLFIDLAAAFARKSLVTVRELQFQCEDGWDPEGFLVSNGLLWVVVNRYPMGYGVLCVATGVCYLFPEEYDTFPARGSIKTLGSDHFCQYQRLHPSSCTVYSASQPPTAISFFEKHCEISPQRQFLDVGSLATGKSIDSSSRPPIVTVVISDSFSGTTLAFAKYPRGFYLI
ncbi:hypothetical protein Pelo_18902 [Pelomyxa schiedti]|nr:hypothetical protein Pelo_18902 [Pelomyxa schiedti]